MKKEKILTILTLIFCSHMTYMAPAFAIPIFTLTPSGGTNILNLRVGDTAYFTTYASSITPGEYITSISSINLLNSTTISGEIVSAVFLPSRNDPLFPGPIGIATWTLRFDGPGSVDMWNGFPACTGLPSSTSGCVITNLGAFRPEDSNHVTFNVQAAIPEPASLALLSIGLAGIAFNRRKKPYQTLAHNE